MHITFRQLQLFQALADTGSVTAAARALHVTQPTASMQLKEISQQVGLPLYEVIGKKVHLTEVGEELADTARSLSARWDAFEQSVSAFKGLARGKLRIAVVSTAQYFMPRLIGSFCQRHPEVDVALEILNRDGVVQRLKHHLDDLYIMSMPPTDMDLQDEVLMSNPLVLIAPQHDDWAERQDLTLRELRTRRFILREAGSGTRMAVDRFFRSQRFRPEVRLELGSNEAVKEAVAGGLGLGIVSRHALQVGASERGIRVLQVPGFPLPSAWHMVHHGAQKLSPLALAFRRHLMAEVTRGRLQKFLDQPTGALPGRQA